MFKKIADKMAKHSVLMSKKTQIIIFFLIFCSLLLSVVAVNYVINPYMVFDHRLDIHYSSDMISDRKLVYPRMKIHKNNKYDYLFCGASNLLLSISEENFKEIFPEEDAYKLTIRAITPIEQYELIEHFIKLHPEVKKIFVAVDFYEMVNDEKNMLPKYKSDRLNSSELYFLLLSQETLKFSLDAIYLTTKEMLIPEFLFYLKKKSFFSKFKIFRNYRYKEVTNYSRFPRVRYTDWCEVKLCDFLYDDLRKIKELCEKNHKEVIFYASPLHSNAIYDIYYQGVYGELERFKREFAKVTPFYDFLYVCKYTNQPISPQNPYWSNAMHADVALGDLIMKKLILDDDAFGVYVTKDNVEDVLKKNKQDLFDYAKKNKDAVDEYVSYGHLDFTTEEEVIYRDE